MPSIATLQNNIRELEAEVSEHAAAGDENEAREASGRLAVNREYLMDAVTEMSIENARIRENPLANDANTASVGARILGNAASFVGLTAGFKARTRLDNAVSGLSTPQIYRTDLPSPVAAPSNFLATILRGETDGDEHFYRTPVLTNAAAGWTSGKKPESALAWTKAVANIEIIAHWIPIPKPTANRYGQLDSIVSNSLMMGLDIKADEYVLRGSNSGGIVGVTNTPGILMHTKKSTKNLKDTFAAMRRKVRVATGIAAGHVCLSPYAIEELSEEKDKNGCYLFPEIANGGTIAGLTIVEDVNMTVIDGESTKETALVYFFGGASFDIADDQEVTVGLKDSQLVENEYTVLAEMSGALRVDNPGAFCYCADLGIEAEV